MLCSSHILKVPYLVWVWVWVCVREENRVGLCWVFFFNYIFAYGEIGKSTFWYLIKRNVNFIHF